VLRETQEIAGSKGYVPYLDAFERMPELASSPSPSGFNTPESGLFWVIDPDHQRQGYATEAARAMIEYAFARPRLKRIIAATEHTNGASQGVMRKVGMTLTRNPFPDPPWLQVVGVPENAG
jgi:RimJ/RimL family protein N-acetyltransferase